MPDWTLEYWIDYRTTPAGGVTRRWCNTYTAFQEDLDDLVHNVSQVVAFGYNTPPLPLKDGAYDRRAWTLDSEAKEEDPRTFFFACQCTLPSRDVPVALRLSSSPGQSEG